MDMVVKGITCGLLGLGRRGEEVTRTKRRMRCEVRGAKSEERVGEYDNCSLFKVK